MLVLCDGALVGDPLKLGSVFIRCQSKNSNTIKYFHLSSSVTMSFQVVLVYLPTSFSYIYNPPKHDYKNAHIDRRLRGILRNFILKYK